MSPRDGPQLNVLNEKMGPQLVGLSATKEQPVTPRMDTATKRVLP